jgi:Flp pilus assembly protein TadD
VYAILPTLHLSTLSLAPAQVYVGIRGRKTERRWVSVAGPFVAAILFWALSRLGNTEAGDLVAETSKGIRAYWALYSDPESARYAFGFFSWTHALAVFNDLLLLAPMALVAVVMGFRNRAVSSPAATFLAIAALGCVLENVFFNREIGPYRDWDALAPYAFVTLAWAGMQLAAEPDRAKNATIWMLGVVALLHTLPWTLLNASAAAAERHVRTVLSEPTMWSPYARGYMYEEFAILARDRGDLQEALREYRAAADASPKDPRYRLGAADIAFLIGDLSAAEHSYREALARRPDYHAAHNNLALLLLRRGDLAGARSHAFEAIRAEPNRLEGYLTLGDIEMQAGDTEAAAEAWSRAYALSPDAAAVLARMQRLRE